MSCTPEQVKEFIVDAKKARESWLVMADKSWAEIKKKARSRRLWSTTPNSTRRKARYPAWWSIFKIRQPLVLSRIGIPIGRDTTQDGTDNIGACAAMLKERLATNLAKDFDFFDVMCCARDDFLATNFGLVRAYYEAKDVKEAVKIRLTVQQDVDGQAIFLNPDGEQVVSDEIEQDDEGWFLETEEVIDVTDERICLEPVLYKAVYIDPSIRRWSRVKQIAFAEEYTEVEFSRIFGKKALLALPKDPDLNENSAKKKTIVVFEYWDLYEKECKWLAENGEDFITPKEYMPSELDEQLNGLYDLEKFFPVPTPLITNQPTDEFWPVPEYYQVADVIEDIHTIFSRAVALTKAIRARLLFDNSVEGLQEAINEAAEGDAFGITNLAQALSGNGGSLEGVVQYVPVEKMIQSLEQMYGALEQRLNVLYKITGTSDMLQGLITDPTQRTFGERQMTEKYALNQIAEPQRKMAEFVCNSYELMCEMALKNFKEESLAKYMMPGTLPEDQKPLYTSALALLKDNNKRFRIELETDSTIALNEEFDKRMRMELVQTLTSALEKTATIAQNSPELLVPELHCLKFLIQGFRQGKMFQSEVTQAIDAVIKKSQQPAAPAFNKDEEALKLKAQELQLKAQEMQIKNQEVQANFQLKEYQVMSDERMQIAKLQQDERLAGITAQLEQLAQQSESVRAQMAAQIDSVKIQSEQQSKSVAAQLDFGKLQADIALAQEELAIKRQELAVEMQQSQNKIELEKIAISIENKMAEQQHMIAVAQQQLAQQKMVLDEREKYATEARLQSEHKLQQMESQLRLIENAKSIELQTQQHKLEAAKVLLPLATQGTDKSKAKPLKKKRKLKVLRDKEGNIQNLEYESDGEEKP